MREAQVSSKRESDLIVLRYRDTISISHSSLNLRFSENLPMPVSLIVKVESRTIYLNVEH